MELEDAGKRGRRPHKSHREDDESLDIEGSQLEDVLLLLQNKKNMNEKISLQSDYFTANLKWRRRRKTRNSRIGEAILVTLRTHGTQLILCAH